MCTHTHIHTHTHTHTQCPLLKLKQKTVFSCPASSSAGVLVQKVKVDPEVVSYPGQTVILCCQFPDKGQTHLTQVSWILENSSATRTNIAVFHPTLGVSYPASPVQGRVSFTKEPPPLEHPTIQITDIALTDEGNYVCEYTTYPTGNENGVTALVILAKPQNTASTITVPAGTSPVSVAQCVSANGRPPATLTWVTNLSGNGTGLVQTSNSDNTVTVRSEYLFTPTAADNGKEITCVVSHRTLTKAENFPMKLVVQYPPQVQIVGYDNNWYVGRTDVVLTCQYQGNPSPPTVNWKMSSGCMPDSVEMAQNKLTVRKVDDSVNTTFICEVTNSLGIGKDQVTVFVRGVLVQKVKVDPEVVSYPGQTVILCCQFPDKGQTQLTQVSWILENSSATRTNIAVFHPTLGVSYPASPVQGRVNFTIEPPPLEHPTIQITDIALTDEGNYVCEYTTHPTGNENGVTALVILAKPQNTASTITVPAGTSPVSVAQCVLANGRPPATLTWVTNLSGNGTGLVQTSNSDNTVTVRIEYLFTPTAADNGKEITCVVSHRTLAKAENFPMKLVVQYPPQVQIVGYDNNWYVGRTDVVLTCQYQGNPSPPTVNWKMSSGFMPDSVEMAQNKLTVRKVDDSVNTTFICEVTNSLGIGKDQVTVFVRGRRETSTNSPPASSTVKQVFIILAVLLLVIPGVVAFICWRRTGGRCGENVITEGRPDCKRKRKDQTEPDVTYSTVTHVNTAGAARVQINAGDKTEYASVITN
ncbi:basement membrane-specific heparan sulfate proteoglycan core protein isoform X2 [Ictalurus punctatus]|uniref:Basement membrane-specific heparan sulfate proteoglycan core protein isoform X2 n=1 Tax=Ictalurus punctatus TaxID=7998 RepID=A0A9F7TRT1_ICTPU|nr:basement membrane-specific heparan sulfate proteoglycan core protein isoform X2 [Ictalurus punctatus]